MGKEQGKRKRYGKHRRQIRIAGKMVEASFTFRKDADDWYGKMRQKKELIEKGLDIGFEAKLFKAWAGQWLSEKKPQIEESTFRTYNGFLKNDLVPQFGQTFVHLIGPRDIENFLFKIKTDRGLANATYNRYRLLLNEIFKDAMRVRPRHAVDNPIDQVKKLIENAPPVKLFEQVDLIETYLSHAWTMVNPAFWMGAMILFNLGARLGEMLGLQAGDVNLSSGTISITRAVDYKTGAIKPYPKGKRHRVLPINDVLAGALRLWFEIAPPESPETPIVRWVADPRKQSDKGRWKNDGRRFSASHFHRLHDELCASLGLPVITVHQIRHTFGTHQADMDGHLRRLQALLGHQDSKTTERYAQLVQERLRNKAGFTVGAGAVESNRKLKLVKGS